MEPATSQQEVLQLQRTTWELQLALRTMEDELHQTKCKLLEYQLEERRAEKRGAATSSSLLASRVTTPRLLSVKSSRSTSQQPTAGTNAATAAAAVAAAAVSVSDDGIMPPFQLEPKANSFAETKAVELAVQLQQSRIELEQWRTTGQLVVASLLTRVQLMHQAFAASSDLMSNAYSEGLWHWRRSDGLTQQTQKRDEKEENELKNSADSAKEIQHLQQTLKDLTRELHRSRIEEAAAHTSTAMIRKELQEEKLARANDVRHMKIQYEEANACRSSMLEELERLREEVRRLRATRPSSNQDYHGEKLSPQRSSLRPLATARPNNSSSTTTPTNMLLRLAEALPRSRKPVFESP